MGTKILFGVDVNMHVSIWQKSINGIDQACTLFDRKFSAKMYMISFELLDHKKITNLSYHWATFCAGFTAHAFSGANDYLCLTACTDVFKAISRSEALRIDTVRVIKEHHFDIYIGRDIEKKKYMDNTLMKNWSITAKILDTR